VPLPGRFALPVAERRRGLVTRLSAAAVPAEPKITELSYRAESRLADRALPRVALLASEGDFLFAKELFERGEVVRLRVAQHVT
jgi:hypothetical protein